MHFRHAGELKPAKVFLDIAYAHLPGLADNWYTGDRLLKETLDALESALERNAYLEGNTEHWFKTCKALEEMLGSQHAVILDLKEHKRLKEECFKANLKHQDELCETIKRLEEELAELRNKK